MHEDHLEFDLTLGPYPPSIQYPYSLASLPEPPPSVHYDQYTVAWNTAGNFHIRAEEHPPQIEYGPLFGDGLNFTGAFPTRPQLAHRSYEDRAIQTDQLDPLIDSHAGKERLVRRRSTLHGPVPQEAYKLTRQVGFADPKFIDFATNGEMGIRLSDASKDDGAGLEGRDDRSLFEGNGSQIILRLHLRGCTPWSSKIPTTDFKKTRRSITRTKLAAAVARSLTKFIAREKLNGHHDGGTSQCRWGDVSLDNVFLTRIVRMSTGSWQPVLYLERPIVASQGAASSSSSPDPLT